MTDKKLPVSACDASGASGGKAPITDGVLDLSAKLPKGSDCIVLATAPLPPLKITLKLVNTTIVKGKPKAVTVATIKPTNVSASVTIGDAISLSISGDVPDKTHTKPFCGEHFSGEFEITNALDLAGRLGGTPINTMALSGPLTIAPVES